MRYVLCLFLALVMALLVTGAVVADPKWYASGDGSGYLLFDGDALLGHLSKSSGRYLSRVDGRYLEMDMPPIDLPEGFSPSESNFGLKTDRIKGRTSFSMNGVPVSKATALARLAEGFADDSGLPRLTIVFRDERTRKQVLDDLDRHPALVKWRGKVLVQEYSPDQWQVRRARLPGEGIFLQEPSGDLVGTLTAYTGPDALDRLLSRSPFSPLPAAPMGVPWAAWGLGGVAALLLLRGGGGNK